MQSVRRQTRSHVFFSPLCEIRIVNCFATESETEKEREIEKDEIEMKRTDADVGNPLFLSRLAARVFLFLEPQKNSDK